MHLSKEDRARFRKHHISGPSTACWEWQAGLNKDGYGRFKVRNHDELAHRVSYTIHHGPIPNYRLVCHSCDNPGCVNPKHLWLGSCGDNTQDMMRKGRHRCAGAAGDSNPRAVLSEDEALQIIDLIMQGLNNKQIAARFGVAHSTISCIRRGKSWKHIARKAG